MSVTRLPLRAPRLSPPRPRTWVWPAAGGGGGGEWVSLEICGS